jgi:hypothetical protein
MSKERFTVTRGERDEWIVVDKRNGRRAGAGYNSLSRAESQADKLNSKGLVRR